MSQLKLNHVTDGETVDSRWSWLYKIGGAAALLVAMIIPIQIIVYIVSPPPSTAIDYFTLFQSNSLLGLLALDLLIIVDIVLGIPCCLLSTSPSDDPVNLSWRSLWPLASCVQCFS